MTTWKDRLAGTLALDLAREIDAFENQIELKRQGKVEDRLFAEARLRRGVYGQRYDNGQRHDGIAHRTLSFPNEGISKGPETAWDAPGMQRIKIPFGGVDPHQMEVLAEVAEEYSDGICHITTRQDVQLHYVHIEDTPDIMRRLGAVGITTREACGNTVRNVTACPLAGVCHAEAFDVTPYAKACSQFLLGHPDTQDMGRKFKIAFSGCSERGCGLPHIHDLGFIARIQRDNGELRRGFKVVVGGGLGAVPYHAKVFDEFVPEDEILAVAQAVCRVFARFGEKKDRGHARMKFLVHKVGIEEFRRLVRAERATLAQDDAWTAFLRDAPHQGEQPLRPAAGGGQVPRDGALEAWLATNTYAQKQGGYAVVTVTLPLGDITAWQLRRLADIARRYVGEDVRTTVEQNVVLRWVAEADLPALYAELTRIGLGSGGAGKIEDIVSCPGTDTCKLGIAASRGLAAELRERLIAKDGDIPPALRDLHIKISGCFNSCGQHHLGDIGFYGVSRKVGGTTVPHFRVLLGGQWEHDAGQFGLTIGAVPAKRIPEFVQKLADKYLAERGVNEAFRDYVTRIGKLALKTFVDEFASVPSYSQDRSYYSDWGDPREFTTRDITTGECAGAVVPRIEFELQAAEQRCFEAQLYLEQGEFRLADEGAFAAMLKAAKGLVGTQLRDIKDDSDVLVREFRSRFFDSGLFQGQSTGQYAGGKFANFLFRRHSAKQLVPDEDNARRLIEEAQLFIEAAYATYGKMQEQSVGAEGASSPAGLPPLPALKVGGHK